MRCLIRVFNFALKDILQYDHPLCKGIILITELFLMINSPFFYKSWTSKFQKCSQELIKFVRVDLNLSIYPKLHLLLRYPDQIKLLGPSKFYSIDIFESCHKLFKSFLLTSANHKNIIKTMFERVSLWYSYKLPLNDTLTESSYSAYEELRTVEHIPCQFTNILRQSIKVFKKIKCGSFLFKEGLYIPYEETKQGFLFYKIKLVFSSTGDDFLFVEEYVFKSWKNFGFFEMLKSNKSEKIIRIYDVWYRPLEIYQNAFILPNCQYFYIS